MKVPNSDFPIVIGLIGWLLRGKPFQVWKAFVLVLVNDLWNVMWFFVKNCFCSIQHIHVALPFKGTLSYTFIFDLIFYWWKRGQWAGDISVSPLSRLYLKTGNRMCKEDCIPILGRDGYVVVKHCKVCSFGCVCFPEP